MIKLGNALMLLAFCGVIIFACNVSKPGSSKKSSDKESSIKITDVVPPSPEFPGATLGIKSVKAIKTGKDSAKVSFVFELKNYELKMQTSDKGTKMCNNSDKGQHIHFILDNQPYKALYEPNNDVVIANGTEHYLMAFLSRSYHESIKTKGAVVVFHFKIDQNGELVKLDDPKTPMIFYSRPKGEYIGNDTANVLLDYYVWNCNIAPKEYKVKATITGHNNESLVVDLDKWESKFLHNLGTGKSKINLQLVDKHNNQVSGPQTDVSREISLISGAEPLKK